MRIAPTAFGIHWAENSYDWSHVSGKAWGRLGQPLDRTPAAPGRTKETKIQRGIEHTVFVIVSPLRGLLHSRGAPQLLGLPFGVLQALFHLYAVVRAHDLAHYRRFAQRRVKGLVSTALGVIDVFANDSPVLLAEDGLAKKAVGVG